MRVYLFVEIVCVIFVIFFWCSSSLWMCFVEWLV